MPSSIPAEQLGYPEEVEYQMDLPEGTDKTALLKKHSLPYLLRNRKAGGPVQLAAHRGLIQFPHAGDNTMASYLRAAKRGIMVIEMDALALKAFLSELPEFVATHDRKAERILASHPGRWNEYTAPEVAGQPIVARQIDKNGNFTDKFFVTNEVVTLVWDASKILFDAFPGLSIIYDAKDGDAAPFGAALSHRPEFYEDSVVTVYPYFIRSGQELINAVEVIGPAPGWKKNIKWWMVPQIEGIMTIAFAGVDFSNKTPREKFNLVFAATKEWTVSPIREGLNVTGATLPVAGIGDRYDIETGTAVDARGVPVVEATLLEKYFQDRVTIELFHHMRKDYPEMPLNNIVRAYDVALGTTRFKWAPVDGKPTPWGKLYDFHEALATSGRLYGKYHFDLYIVDQFFRCLEDLYRFDNKLPRTLTSENPSADLNIDVIEKLPSTRSNCAGDNRPGLVMPTNSPNNIHDDDELRMFRTKSNPHF